MKDTQTETENARSRFEVISGDLYRKSDKKRVQGSTTILGNTYTANKVKNLVLYGCIEGVRILKPRDCRYCGEALPEKELRMQSHAHYDCWHKQVMEDRAKDPVIREGYHKDEYLN